MFLHVLSEEFAFGGMGVVVFQSRGKQYKDWKSKLKFTLGWMRCHMLALEVVLRVEGFEFNLTLVQLALVVALGGLRKEAS